jgi:hypothetical protein
MRPRCKVTVLMYVSFMIVKNPSFKGLSDRVSTGLTLLLACVVLASGSAIHDGVAGRSLIEVLGTLAIGSVGISAQAIDVDFVGRSTKGLKIVAAIPAIWMLIQLLPTPIGAHSIWAFANEALGQRSWGHISVDLGQTTLALAFYLTNVALVLVGIFVARDRRHAELILYAFTAIAAITAVGLLVGKWGLIARVTNPDEVLSAISALGILLSLTSGMRAIERYERRDARTAASGQNTRTALIAIGVGLIVDIVGLSAAATLNVGLVALFGIATFGSVQLMRRVGLGNWPALILVGTMVIAAAMVTVWRYDSSRNLSLFLQFASASSADAISMTQRMLSDSRWLGTGAGTFGAILPIYRDLGSSITQPPTTISGFAVELGLPISLFVIALAAWLTVILYRGALNRGRDSFYPAAAAAGTVILFGQAFCDASLLNPSIAILGAALIGLGLAQSLSGRDGF